MPEKLMPREVLGRSRFSFFSALSGSEEFDLSVGSRSLALRADLDRDSPGGRSLDGEEALSSLDLDSGLAAGVAPQKPQEEL